MTLKMKREHLAPGPGEGAWGKPGELAEGPADEGASHPPGGPGETTTLRGGRAGTGGDEDGSPPQPSVLQVQNDKDKGGSTLQ